MSSSSLRAIICTFACTAFCKSVQSECSTPPYLLALLQEQHLLCPALL